MGEPYIGEIRMFGFDFAPMYWAFCNGDTLSLNDKQALFAVIGTTYGGDARRGTFMLPNLKGRAALNPGMDTLGCVYRLGTTGGEEKVSLLRSELPAHGHTAYADVDQSTATSPAGQLAAVSQRMYAPDTSAPVAMSTTAMAVAGGGQAHANMQPYLALNFCIALDGIFPTPGD